MKRLIKQVLIIFSLLNFSIISNAQTNSAIKNIVIVHGAFADGSGWQSVFEILTKQGYNVTVVQNPLTSLEDDVAATNRILDKQDGPVVLVGHSWGEPSLHRQAFIQKWQASYMLLPLHPM
jgi:pimeloyl-ACP methyl ester carboxylesterase